MCARKDVAAAFAGRMAAGGAGVCNNHDGENAKAHFRRRTPVMLSELTDANECVFYFISAHACTSIYLYAQNYDDDDDAVELIWKVVVVLLVNIKFQSRLWRRTCNDECRCRGRLG